MDTNVLVGLAHNGAPYILNTTELVDTWKLLQAQITPFNQILNFSGQVYRALDKDGKAYFAQNLMQHTHSPVMFCRDGTGYDRYFLGGPQEFLKDEGILMDVAGTDPFWFPRLDTMQLTTVDTAKPESIAKKMKEKKIPRPPNAYILYRKERHHSVKNANPGISNNEISQVLGAAWNRESPEIRNKYKKMSDELKQAFLEQNPDYNSASRLEMRPQESTQGVLKGITHRF
ncbi:MAT1-2-1 like protein [Emericellopsis cladophorae]|uniref:MAT1-2-1 like protein n=1 Tax=Emericellopsis cladophorae TaxID=2686198 RepID=A0A9Q0BDV6_9HYPO|nr:MAT1-2-1 like protein [Emericellopsis cladophorae]KAI6780589.1 MAT1-2-1 like protein [Emericellopsis cladophorae]